MIDPEFQERFLELQKNAQGGIIKEESILGITSFGKVDTPEDGVSLGVILSYEIIIHLMDKANQGGEIDPKSVPRLLRDSLRSVASQERGTILATIDDDVAGREDHLEAIVDWLYSEFLRKEKEAHGKVSSLAP